MILCASRAGLSRFSPAHSTCTGSLAGFQLCYAAKTSALLRVIAACARRSQTLVSCLPPAVLVSVTSACIVCVQRARRVALGGKRKRLSVRAVCASQHAPLCACSLFLLELRDLTLLSLSPKSCGRELHSQLCPHIMVCMDVRSMLPNTT